MSESPRASAPFHAQDHPDLPRQPEGEPRRVVVVGIDGSPQSQAALLWALRYVEAFDLEVRVVAVWAQPVQFADPGLAPAPADFEAEARRWLADALSDGATSDGATPRLPARVEARMEQGNPAHVLLDHARTAEMIVLGSHGRGALDATLLGSVAQRCAQHAKCPVVLIPSP
jgi:nucleotide-binding universal stress UspA family protein